MELTRVERRERVKSFHAEIARRAALVVRKPNRTYFIPNAPLWQPKYRAEEDKPVIRNVEPDYWHHMWFHDLIFGRSVIGPKPLRVEDIIRATAREFGLSKIDLISMRRTKDVVLPRQIAMYLAKTMTGRSLPDIANRFGGRDHTTALHAIRKIENALATDSDLRERVHKVKLAVLA